MIRIEDGKGALLVLIEELRAQRPASLQMSRHMRQRERFSHAPVRAVALLHRILRPAVDKERGIGRNEVSRERQSTHRLPLPLFRTVNSSPYT